LRKILIASANRAERGLLEPIMAELKKIKDVDAKWFFFESTDAVYLVLEGFRNYLAFFQPDIVLVPSDRFEMVYITAFAFHRGYIVAQFHAGDTGSGVSDEMNRFAMSFMSHILFCETITSATNLTKLGFNQHRIFAVGSTAFDHVKIDESLCPNEPYDLVLLHPDSISATATKQDLLETQRTIEHSPLVVWIAGNHDNNSEIIHGFLERIKAKYDLEDPNKWYFGPYIQVIMENVPRPKFLGLLKNCRRFIGNSSAMCYEAPRFNAECVRVGNRNKDRLSTVPVLGGAYRIATILATIPIDDSLRRRTFKL
jgi:GDP/UDP-N,N'-diacetylbacillosamine 2-epimerase (hydrolysing)